MAQPLYHRLRLRLGFALDTGRWQHSVTRVIGQHEALRTDFSASPHLVYPLQVVSEAPGLAYAYTDLSESGAEAQERFIRQQADAAGAGQKVAALLFKHRENDFSFVLQVDPLRADAFSLRTLTDAILDAYAAKPPSDAPAIGYPQFAAWQNGLAKSPNEEAVAFWKEYAFAGPGPAALPLASAPAGGPADVRMVALPPLPPGAAQPPPGIPLEHLLLGCWLILLHRHTGTERVTAGTVFPGRGFDPLKPIVGPVARTIPVVAAVDEAAPLSTFVSALAASAAELTEWEEYFQSAELHPDIDRHVFPFGYEWQDFRDWVPGTPGGWAGIADYSNVTEPHGLKLCAHQYAEGLRVRLQYDAAVYTPLAADLLGGQFNALLAAALAHPEARIGALSMLGAPEQARLLAEFNPPPHRAGNELTVVELFEKQVLATPGHVAVAFGDRQLTYRALDEQATQLARYLTGPGNLRPGDIVAVNLEVSEWLVVSILGVLKAGLAFLPVDTNLPRLRQELLLEKARARLVLTGRAYGEAPCPYLAVQASWEQIASAAGAAFPSRSLASGPAYVMYTSGSTGEPKGVVVSHGSLANYLVWAQQYYYQNQPGWHTALFTSISFDLSLTVLFGTLIRGDRLALYDGNDLETALRQAFGSDLVQAIKLTPSHVSAARLLGLPRTGIRSFILGGEPLTAEQVGFLRELNGQARIYNEYGPTEATIGCTAGEVQPGEPITAGQPIANARIYVLGENGQLQPTGVPGEIFIGGACLAQGYLNAPELTRDRFVPDPFAAGGRMYKSGDLGLWLPDGRLLLKGRQDTQVKHKGYRIELSEIAAVLRQAARVNRAEVLQLTAGGETHLCAYVESRHSPDPQELKHYLAERLPAYMVPAHYVVLEAFPVTVNGKIDFGQLPTLEEIAAKAARGAGPKEKPRNELEAILLVIWEQVLLKQGFGVKDNFFDLGGHSISAMRVMSRVHKEWGVGIVLKDFFEQPTIEQLAQKIRSSEMVNYRPLRPVEEQEYYDLSQAQLRLWITDRSLKDRSIYNITIGYAIEGNLNRAAMAQAFGELVKKHEVLRSRLIEVGDKPRQTVDAYSDAKTRVHFQDLRGTDDAEAAAKALCQREAKAPFDLAAGPVIRASLFQLAEQRHIFLLTMHHIAGDAWSVEVLGKELSRLYLAFSAGAAAGGPAPRLQYKDYAAWENDFLRGDHLGAAQAYWKAQFARPVPVLDLPTDYPRSEANSGKGDSVSFLLERSLVDGLKELGRRQGTTLFMNLVAIVKVLLNRYTGNEDLVVGTPIAGRDQFELHDQLGVYINTLAIRTGFSSTDPYRALLAKVKESLLNANKHQRYPFNRLMADLNVRNTPGRSPLFDVMVGIQDIAITPFEAPDLQLKVEQYPVETGRSKFDLTIDFAERQHEITASVEFNTNLFSRATVERMAAHLAGIAARVVADPSVRLCDLDYLTPAEQDQFLRGFQGGPAAGAAATTVHGWFEAQAARTPDHPALVWEGQSLTYRELNARANQLAAFLRETYQVGTEDLVALLMHRSDALIISQLAVLKSGAAYVPINPDDSAERKKYILEDTRAKVLLTNEAFSGAAPAPVVHWQHCQDALRTMPAANPDGAAAPGTLAYAIYTSGSSGKPKGVLVEHQAIVNTIAWNVRYHGKGPGTRLLQLMSVAFDGAVLETYPVLLSGGTLVIPARGKSTDGLHLLELVGAHRVTDLLTIPSFYRVLLHLMGERAPASLRSVVLAGEPLPQSLVQAHYRKMPGVSLVNEYGPTEAAVCCTATRVAPDEPIISIGAPIDGTAVYVLGSQRELLPAGVEGELYVAGRGLARGYLNNPELTAERFVHDARYGDTRLYRTGDRGTWRPEGKIEYKGRRDLQVKIRGYRVELEEIEQVLAGYPGLRAAAVTATDGEGDRPQLVAYLQWESAPDPDGLQAYADSRLPEYMVPARYVSLAGLPRHANGKIDRAALPAAGKEAHPAPASPVPASAGEAVLAGIWEEVLGKKGIGAEDDFFEAGGNSLDAIQVVAYIQQRLGVELSLQTIFSFPTIRALARIIGENGNATGAALQPVEEQEYYELVHPQRQLWISSQLDENRNAFNTSTVNLITGTLAVDVLQKAVHVLGARHEILRTGVIVVGGAPKQKVLAPEACPPDFAYVDLTADPGGPPVEKLIDGFTNCAFDLRQAPLWNVRVVRFAADKYAFVLVMHHILSDMRSVEVFFKELTAVYNAGCRGQEIVLPPLPVQYKDCLSVQHEEAAHRAYWMQKFAGAVQPLSLPTDYPRPAVRSFSGRSVRFGIDYEATVLLNILGREGGASLFMVLAAIVKTLLFKLTAKTDITICSPVAGRVHPDTRDIMGFFVNTLPLRTGFGREDSFTGLVQKVKATVLEAFDHQSYPMDALIGDLKWNRNHGQNPLFEVNLGLHNVRSEQGEAGVGMAIEQYLPPKTVSRFDLTFNVFEVAEGLSVEINYDTDLFREETILAYRAAFENLVAQVTQNPLRPLREIRLGGPADDPAYPEPDLQSRYGEGF